MAVEGFGRNGVTVSPLSSQQRQEAHDVQPRRPAETPPQRVDARSDAPSDLVAARVGISDRHRQALERRLLEADRHALSHSPGWAAQRVEEAAREVERAADPAYMPDDARSDSTSSPRGLPPYAVFAFAFASPVDIAARAANELERQAGFLSDPRQVDALLKLVGPTLDVLASRLGGGDSSHASYMVGALTRVAEKAGDEGAALLARTAARQFSGESSVVLVRYVEEVVKDGGGVRFAAALVEELVAASKHYAAREVARAIASGVAYVREQFDKAHDKVEELNKQLAHNIYASSQLLTPDEVAQASRAFYDKHADAYVRLEEAGRLLSTTLQEATYLRDAARTVEGAGTGESCGLAEEAEAVLWRVVNASQTEAGREAIAKALEERADGRETFLDSLSDLVADSPDLEENVAIAVLRSVGEAAVAGARSGRADKLLKGFERSAELFGASPGQMKAIVHDLKELSHAGSTREVESLTRQINGELNDIPAFDVRTRAGKAFRGLAFAFAGLNVSDGLSDWDRLNGWQRAQVILNGLEGGAMVVEFAAGTLGKTSAMRLAGKAANLAGLVSAGFDIVIGVDKLADGKHLEGGASLTTGAGGVLLSVGLMSNSVPVAGTVIGGLLLAAGFGLSLYAGARESNKNERPLEDFLRDAGLSPKLAEELSNHDGRGRPVVPVLAELAKHLGVEPRELILSLDTLDERDIHDIVEAAHGVDPNDEGVYPQTGGDVARIGDATPGQLASHTPEARPHSVEGLALYLERMNLLPRLP
ncbi:MAG TPA: hypothetical protein VK422_06775 [Pyrinomonadaceae bacterium]|nr:hypothetical protein [Pyrinomonadaceae bacterium]